MELQQKAFEQDQESSSVGQYIFSLCSNGRGKQTIQQKLDLSLVIQKIVENYHKICIIYQSL